MEDILNTILVEGDLLSTFINLFIFALCIDGCFGIAHAIGTVKRSIS